VLAMAEQLRRRGGSRARLSRAARCGAVTILLVGAGGVIGVLSRYALGMAVSHDTLPWVTVAINVAGSFLLGLVVTVDTGLSPEVRSAVAVGVLGGFTTFSVDALRYVEAGEGGKAVLYVLASVILGIGAAAVGLYTGRAAT